MAQQAEKLLKAYGTTMKRCPGAPAIFCPTSSVDHRHRAILSGIRSE
jgi:hypothetical protein